MILKTEELKNKLETDSITLFDVRGDIEYEKGHIPGSKSAPLGSLNFRVAAVMNPDSPIAVYSGGGDCKLFAEAAERLGNLGLRNVYRYEAGIKGWVESGNFLEISNKAKTHTHGPVTDCRPIIVDRTRAYGGAFNTKPTETEGAGG